MYHQVAVLEAPLPTPSIRPRRGSSKRSSAQTTLFDLFARVLVARGHGLFALSFFFATTIERVLSETIRLGLPTPHNRPLRVSRRADAWTQEQIQELMLLWPTNLYASCIAERIGRSAGSVRYKAKWLGLPARARGDLRGTIAREGQFPSVPAFPVVQSHRKRRHLNRPLEHDILIGEYHLTGVDHAVTAAALGLGKHDAETRASSLGLPSRHFMRGRLFMNYDANRDRLPEFQSKNPWVIKKCLSGRRWFYSNQKGQRFAPQTKKTTWYRDMSGGADEGGGGDCDD